MENAKSYFITVCVNAFHDNRAEKFSPFKIFIKLKNEDVEKANKLIYVKISE
jgi:hypothetical protein